MKPSAERVALICDYSLGYLGGAQTALIQQAVALAERGAEVLIVSPTSEPDTGASDRARIEHAAIPALITLPGLDLPVIANTARVRRRLRTILTEHRITVVHLHSEFGLAAAAAMTAESLGLPVLHTVHTFFWQTTLGAQGVLGAAIPMFHSLMTRLRPTRIPLADRPGDSALRNMTLTVARQADWVVSPSAHQGAKLRAAGLARVTVIRNTITLDQDNPPQLLHRVGQPLRILWIGRCEPEKRILPFVRAVRAAVDRLGPGRLSCTVVGVGSQLSEAERIAGGSGDITFLGRRPHDTIPGLLADAHLLALTSYGFDNQPMSVVEAVTAGRGVLYCDPALTEGLDGPGILMPADESGMTTTLTALAGDPDPVIAASHAAGRARDDFAPSTHADRILELSRRARLIKGAGRR